MSSSLDTNRMLDIARSVLTTEARGILAVCDVLDQTFIQALDIILRCKGHLIVTGVGKSGHIGKKLAATFASTGTPSFFLHPTEASHGDLGMIGAADCLLVLSNSGETSELSDLLAYAQHTSVPLIAMVREINSTLARQATCTLRLPPHPEACSLKMAPTTSTAQSLALGDALAVALMNHRGFSPKDFYLFHPGGKLGKRFMIVADLMHTDATRPLCFPETSLAQALITMSEKAFGCVAVIDKQKETLLGIITDGDLRRHMRADLLEKTARDVMTAAPRTVTPKTLVIDAIALMNDRKISVLLVTDADNRCIGLLHMHDCLRAGF